MAQRNLIRAVRPVPAEPAALFEFLSDLENHWRIAGAFVQVVALDGPAGRRHGGLVRMRGPLGIRRMARTRVLSASPPREMLGRAELSGGTTATVRWSLWPATDGTRVELAALVDAASPLDRLLLAAGGRAWLRRRFAGALDQLASVQPTAVSDTEHLERRASCRVSSRS